MRKYGTSDMAMAVSQITLWTVYHDRQLPVQLYKKYPKLILWVK